jgi:uncharacterized membrane protein YoaK (UPF0700 family)
MFRQGRPRAFIHNLRLATMLSFVAGTVNICGVLSIQTLTTNVTGHFAFFSEEFVGARYDTAFNFLSYIACFLAGAFVSGFLIEVMLKFKPDKSHTPPMLLEIAVLIVVVFAGEGTMTGSHWVARALLFAMGLQNALVTKVSQATVRTTHLTGLFTDLGIELSQFFFYKAKDEKRKLSRSIYLRLSIILFFFFGGVAGGFLYKTLHLYTLVIAVIVLITALIYDNIRIGLDFFRRKLTSK